MSLELKKNEWSCFNQLLYSGFYAKSLENWQRNEWEGKGKENIIQKKEQIKFNINRDGRKIRKYVLKYMI